MSNPYCTTISVPLTKNQSTVISPEDSDLVALKWYAQTHHSGGFYAVRGGAPKIYLHRVILERVLGRPLLSTEYTDHIDGDKLNNARSNLRVATPCENQHNRKRNKNNTSGYPGINWNKRKQRWIVRLMKSRVTIEVGSFKNLDDAIAAYKQSKLEHHGEFPRAD